MRAVICGAGIAGLTLACLLDRMGWDVQQVERANSLRRKGYMIDFFGPVSTLPSVADGSMSSSPTPELPPYCYRARAQRCRALCPGSLCAS